MRHAREFFALALVALLIVTAAPAGAAVEHGASVGYCEGCDNGNVILTMDGGDAVVFGLVELANDPGHYTGQGSLHYNAQGLAIADDAATFDVHLVPSPTGKVVTPTDCTRATKLTSAIVVRGGKGASAYTLTTSDFEVDVQAPCARAFFSVTIEQAGKANGLKKRNITVTGRKLRP